jgi:hypothetical protein
MSNMSYCRFQNTEKNLRDCLNAMRGASSISVMDLSNDEYESFQEMTSLVLHFRIEADRLLADNE